MKIQKELDETKIVLHKTIESVLQRGEKIDDLVQKSDGLSSQSKMFYRKFFGRNGPGIRPILTFTLRTSKEAEFVLVSHSQNEPDGPTGLEQLLPLEADTDLPVRSLVM